MPTKSIYTNRKYIELEFECLPSNYSTVVMRNKMLRDTSKQKYDGEKEKCKENDLEKLSLSDFMLSIGTIFAKAQGTSYGYLYYNELNQMQKNQKYSIYCLEEADGSLRVDFLPLANDIFNEHSTVVPLNHDSSEALSETVSLQEAQTASRSATDLSASLRNPSTNSYSVASDESDFFRKTPSGTNVTDDNYQVPIIVFQGGKLQFLTDRVSPFIGVVEFI